MIVFLAPNLLAPNHFPRRFPNVMKLVYYLITIYVQRSIKFVKSGGNSTTPLNSMIIIIDFTSA